MGKLLWKISESLLSGIRRFQDIDETVMTCRSDKVVNMDQYALRVGALRQQCQWRKLWPVCTETTDNSSMARKVVSKTGIENCIVYFDHILNAEWLSYQIQDTLYGLYRPLQIMLFFSYYNANAYTFTKMLLDNIKSPLKCSRNARPNFFWTQTDARYVKGCTFSDSDKMALWLYFFIIIILYKLMPILW